jgi:hypothetical protein
MLLKEIFSKKTNLLEENLQNKVLNTILYEKSYIRGSITSDHSTTEVFDNDSLLSNTFKNKVKTLKYLKEKKSNYKIKVASIVENPDKSLEGQSICTQSFLYKNRKSEGFRFSASILKPSLFKNHIDTLYKSVVSLKHSCNQNSSSLLVLTPKRGGFICYASGILGFLPKKHGSSLFRKTLLVLLKDKKIKRRLENVLLLTRKQDNSNRSFLLRLRCFLGKFRFAFRKRRKKFSLSRKKSGKKSSYRRYTMLFLSHIDNQQS